MKLENSKYNPGLYLEFFYILIFRLVPLLRPMQ